MKFSDARELMEDKEIIQEFLVESQENLARLDRDLVELERQAGDQELLASIFRTIHTIKGTCGFLGFNRLEAIAHASENLFSDLRAGKRQLTAELITLILEAVDAMKQILACIEAGEGEGSAFEHETLHRLKEVLGKECSLSSSSVQIAIPVTDTAPPVSKTSNAAESALRVDVGLLDKLMDLVGELVLTRNQVLQYNALHEDVNLAAISQRLNLITSELQEGVMKTRMQPIGVVWNKLPRMVRDLATALQKNIDLSMDGAGTELDRTIIEAIKDPLTHIVRNSCDHGIEFAKERTRAGKSARGTLSLRAFHEDGQVNIEIEDDGSGIDPHVIRNKAVERQMLTQEQAQRLSDRDAVNLVFAPGFSTAGSVTSISGRGVGMDVVRTSIERIGGSVDILSTPGRGTTVRVRIPLTLAIIPGLVIWSGGERFLVPQASLHELIRLEGQSARARVEYIHQTPVFRLRNRLIPLVDLNRVLNLPSAPLEDLSIVVLQAGDDRFGLIVDTISDTQEIVVKPLGQHLKGLNCYAGATIMGDGKIALILDIAGLAERAQVFASALEAEAAALDRAESATIQNDQPLLLFRAGPFARIAMPLDKVSRLEEIPRDRLEQAAGRTVVQYRERLLPLVPLAEMLGGPPSADRDLLQVAVYRAGAHDLGLVVDEITDIICEPVGNAQGSQRPGLLGSAIVGNRVTDFLDLDAVSEWAAVSNTESLTRLHAVLGTERKAGEALEVVNEV